jgi:uncharacterized protein (DUF736 family)
MTTIATLKPIIENNIEKLVGEIRTLQFSLDVCFVPIQEKHSERSPDYKIYSGTWDKESIQVGTAWKKQKLRSDGSVFEFLSITIDDPSLPHALNVAAFPKEDGNWDITFRRRQSQKSA